MQFENADAKWIIWGAGKNGKRIYDFLRGYGEQVAFFVDINKQLQGQTLENIEIKMPEEIISSCKICISVVGEAKRIKEFLVQKLNIKQNSIYYYTQCIVDIMIKNRSIIEDGYEEKDKKHRLIITGCANGLGLGGVERWNLTFGAMLKEKGYDIKYLLKNSDAKDKIEDYITIDIPDFREYSNIESTKKIMKVILCNKPAVLITNYCDNFFLTACVAKFLYPTQVKLISVVHGGREALIDNYACLEFLIDIFIGVAQRGICDKLEKCGIDKKKICHVVCPVPCSNVLEREYKKSGEVLKVGYAGRLDSKDKDKRVDYLIPLISLMEESGKAYELNIAGEGDFKEKIQVFIEQQGCDNHVNLLGLIAREDMTQFWKEQDVFLNVSDSEGNSMAMMEAMAQGVVPVLTDVSGVRDSVVDGVNGFIVNRGDLKKIKDYICYLDDNCNLLEQLGRKAHRAIAEKYNKQEMLKRLEECICN